MKSSLKLIALTALILLVFSATGCTRVNPGYVGVVVTNTGSDRGITIEQPGYVWHWITTNVYEFPTFVQTAKWTREVTEGEKVNQEASFNSGEGLTITADVSLSYRLAADHVKEFYVKFRSDDLTTFTDGYLRNVVRDAMNAAASAYPVEQIYGPKKEEFLAKVKQRINDQVKPIGIIVEQFGVIGTMRLPEQVVAALNAKITATQQAMQSENELRVAQAEAAKRVAAAEGDAKAKFAAAVGQAKANLELANSISPQLIEWRRLEIMGKWNGVLPVVQTGSSGGMILNIPNPVSK